MQRIIRRAPWALLWAMGCDPDPMLTYEPDDAREPALEHESHDPLYRGPGRWLPSLEARSAAVDISLITSGLMKGESVLANSTGDHAVFFLGGNACAVDATTGHMDTDTTVDGTVIEVSDVQGDRALVLSSTGIQEVTLAAGGLGMGGEARTHRSGRYGWPRYVGDQVVALTADCEVSWDDGSLVALPEEVCASELEVVPTDSGLLLGGPLGLLSVEPSGLVWLQHAPLEHLALDPATGSWLTSTGSTLTARGAARWSVALGEGVEVEALADGGAFGLFLVHLVRDGDRAVEVFDAATGEHMGVLDLRESTSRIDVSPEGGLLLQVRRDDVVSWRISR